MSVKKYYASGLIMMQGLLTVLLGLFGIFIWALFPLLIEVLKELEETRPGTGVNPTLMYSIFVVGMCLSLYTLVLGIMMCLPSAQTLNVDQNGFSCRWLLRRKKFLWRDCSEIGAFEHKLFGFRINTFAGFNHRDAKGFFCWMMRCVSGYDYIITKRRDIDGMDLAQELNHFKQMAGYGVGRANMPAQERKLFSNPAQNRNKNSTRLRPSKP